MNLVNVVRLWVDFSTYLLKIYAEEKINKGEDSSIQIDCEKNTSIEHACFTAGFVD